MGYRGHGRGLVDITSPTDIVMENGVTSDFAISCWYDAGGHHCHKKITPIHLLDEGYTHVEMILDDQPVGLSYLAAIDTVEDWIIRISLKAQIDEAVESAFRCRYTLYAHANEKTDMVCKGTLKVLPATWKSGE